MPWQLVAIIVFVIVVFVLVAAVIIARTTKQGD